MYIDLMMNVILEIIESNFKNARHTVNAIVIKSIFYLFNGFIKI